MMDLSNATDAELTFDLAYALYSAVDFSDTLQLLISTDCGFTWNVAYHKFDDALTTVPNITEDFFIPTAQEWREETVDLNPYLGNSTVLVKFRHATDYENNLYIDDINIDAITSIEDHGIQGTVSVYPNPSNGMAYIDVQLNTAENVKIEVLNGVGELVTSTEEHTRKTVYELNLTNHPAGIYYVNVKTETGSKTEKIILTR